MTIDRRTVAFIVAHPLRSYRHVKACRAPWPNLPDATVPASVYLPAVAAVATAEAIIDDEARRVAMGNHPAGKGRAS